MYGYKYEDKDFDKGLFYNVISDKKYIKKLKFIKAYEGHILFENEIGLKESFINNTTQTKVLNYKEW